VQSFVGEVTRTWNQYGHAALIYGDGYIESGLPSDETDFGNLTIMGWVSATDTGTDHHLISGIYYDDDNFFYFGRENNELMCEIKAGGLYTKLTDPVVGYNDGEIHQFAISSGPSGVYLYYDGKPVVSGDAIGTSTTDDNQWAVGALSVPGDTQWGWLGIMSSIVFWNHPLTEKDIYETYKLGPSLGTGGELDPAFYGAISPASSSFNPAWAYTSNQVL
jgi:hypothetical protein